MEAGVLLLQRVGLCPPPKKTQAPIFSLMEALASQGSSERPGCLAFSGTPTMRLGMPGMPPFHPPHRGHGQSLPQGSSWPGLESGQQSFMDLGLGIKSHHLSSQLPHYNSKNWNL